MLPPRHIRQRRSHPLAAGALLLCVLGAGAAAACGESRAAGPAAQRSVAAAEAGLPQVVAIEVAEEDLAFTVTMPGSVQALEAVDLHAKVGGYLGRLEVDIGDEVGAGDLLAVIHVPEMAPELRRHEAELELARSQVEQASAAVERARAALAAAEADLTRVQAARKEREADLALRRVELERWQDLLAASQSIEKRKLDEARYRRDAAEAALAVAQAEVVSARARIAEAGAALRKAGADESAAQARVKVAAANLEVAQELVQYTEIRAPFRGVITARHVHPGDFIRPAGTSSGASPLLRIERVDRVRVAVDLPMDSVAALNRGDRVLFANLPAAPGARFEGRVARLSGALGERSRMMRAEVELDNPVGPGGERPLRPGFYGDLTIYLDEYPATPTIPASALVSRGEGRGVIRIEDGIARFRPIRVLFQDGSRVGVAEGLSPGQLVIASGGNEIEDGQRVRVRMAASGGA